MTNIHFDYKNLEDKDHRKELEQITCEYVLVNDESRETRQMSFKPYQYKILSKSELENLILIQEIGEQRKTKEV